jgi:DNA-directed RNA polymerase specialized sigma24 family protein
VALTPFQTLIDGHGRTVHRYLVAIVGAHDADDCWQEAFLSALRAYPELHDAANLRGWLLTIAHRKALDHLRAQARRPVPVAEIGSGAPDPSPSHGDPALVVGPDPVWEQVAALAPKQRAAVALRFLGDLSHAEIAAATQTSEAAARRNLHEGLSRLRTQL